MEENRLKIIDLFRKYGFMYRKSHSNDKFLAFTYKTGFFHNAELVAISEKENEEIVRNEMSNSLKELEKLGFSTKIKIYKNYEEIKDNLFNGFFNVDEWREDVLNEYDDYCTKVLSVLPKEAQEYKFVDVDFTLNDNKTDSKIIKTIIDSLRHDGPHLSIIEAPAGFGKTCTSYEIIRECALDPSLPIPFFTEFSRDRQARIFNHIFVTEVDRKFTSVNSDLVTEEVKEGRILVVLDGFDELLHDSSSDFSEGLINDENAEPMLETISELLTLNAKVILTSRRSAIFDGEMFNQWVERYSNKFEISRYKLNEPKVSDWICESRFEQLNNSKIDINKLANPVLLSYLRFTNDECFNDLCNESNSIIDKYFLSMLEREMERQELRMSPDEQSELLRIIASDMAENNYTSDSKEKIIEIIKTKGEHLLTNVRKIYSPKDRPTIDKLATTLSNHAFLDRSSQGENRLEFVNEFVFGNYIAQDIISFEDYGEWICFDERFVEPAVMSYISRDDESKDKLWHGIDLMKDFIPHNSRMKYEEQLTSEISDVAYDDSDISAIELTNVPIFINGHISRSIFNDCVFKNIMFNFENMKDITFLNCVFWDCNYDIPSEERIPTFLNCKDNNEFIQEIENFEDENDEVELDVETYLLNKIWPIGSQTLERLHFFTGLLYKTIEFDRKEITKGIKSLKRKEILVDANNASFLAVNKDRISDIKIMLGR